MMLLAVIIPVLMLGVLLALGRYEELVLPSEQPEEEVPPLPGWVAPTSSRARAGTPAASP
jgi:hypothetical protein